MTQTSPYTALLHDWARGDTDALNRLMPLVYEELRRLAAWHLQSSPGLVEPRTLVHELYLRLANGNALSFQNRAHFFAAAGRMMRQILIDFYRAKKAGKRGGEGIAVTLDDSIAAEDMRELDVVDLDRALNELSEMNPKGAELLELRFFVGLTLEETAAALDISVASVKREQLASECWLAARLRGKAE